MPDPGPSLRWGRRADRAGMGALLVVAGGVALAGSNVYALPLAALGILAHVAGWALLPAAGWRRIVAASVSTPAVVLLLAGPRYLGVLVVCYLAWMLARHRPPRAWITALFPAAGAVIATMLRDVAMLPALGLMAAVLVASAWIAAYLSSGRFGAPSRHLPGSGRPADS